MRISYTQFMYILHIHINVILINFKTNSNWIIPFFGFLGMMMIWWLRLIIIYSSWNLCISVDNLNWFFFRKDNFNCRTNQWITEIYLFSFVCVFRFLYINKIRKWWKRVVGEENSVKGLCRQHKLSM